jgi:hypothetical protein
MTQKVLVQRLILISAIAIFAVMFPSWIEGKSRPGVSNQTMGERLNQFPKQLGEWECISEEQLKPEVERVLRCHGYIVRVYWNAKTGDRISLALLYGPRGPMAVHTPEICYSSRGRTPVGEPRDIAPRGNATGHSFWQLSFKQSAEPKPDLEVWYAWSDGGEWVASSRPRYWTTDNLFKIQIAGTPGSDGEDSSCESFLQGAVPAFQNLLQFDK